MKKMKRYSTEKMTSMENKIRKNLSDFRIGLMKLECGCGRQILNSDFYEVDYLLEKILNEAMDKAFGLDTLEITEEEVYDEQ